MLNSEYSTNTNACEQFHGDPSDMEIATGMIEDVARFADADTQGFEAATEQRRNRLCQPIKQLTE